jgi:hypothetical protein
MTSHLNPAAPPKGSPIADRTARRRTGQCHTRNALPAGSGIPRQQCSATARNTPLDEPVPLGGEVEVSVGLVGAGSAGGPPVNGGCSSRILRYLAWDRMGGWC